MFWRKSADAILEEMLVKCDDGQLLCLDGVYRRKHSGVLRQVVQTLRQDGMNPAEILSLLALIIDLIAELGAAIGEIVERIRRRKEKQ